VGRISIHFFQPIATAIGHPEPGGFKLETKIDSPLPLRKTVASLKVNGLNLLAQLQREPIHITVAINGRPSTLGLDTEVRDGDEVTILPIYGGG